MRAKWNIFGNKRKDQSKQQTSDVEWRARLGTLSWEGRGWWGRILEQKRLLDQHLKTATFQLFTLLTVIPAIRISSITIIIIPIDVHKTKQGSWERWVQLDSFVEEEKWDQMRYRINIFLSDAPQPVIIVLNPGYLKPNATIWAQMNRWCEGASTCPAAVDSSVETRSQQAAGFWRRKKSESASLSFLSPAVMWSSLSYLPTPSFSSSV